MGYDGNPNGSDLTIVTVVLQYSVFATLDIVYDTKGIPLQYSSNQRSSKLPSIKPITIPKETTTDRKENGKEQNKPTTNFFHPGESLNFSCKAPINTNGVANIRMMTIKAPSPKTSPSVTVKKSNESMKTEITEAFMPDIIPKLN
jgi:hypothetical protein